MKLDYVTIEKRDGIAIVRFDRKANLNAFNEKLVVELTHAARSFHEDLDTHAVVLAGAPNGFSAGFDASPASERASSISRMRKIESDCSSERTPERMTSSRICAEYCHAKTASRPAVRPSASILATERVRTLCASSISSETRRGSGRSCWAWSARCSSCSSNWVTRIVLSSPTAALAPATIRISPR